MSGAKTGMIRNLIFDMGGVIITLSPEVAMERFRQLGVANAFELMGIYGHKDIFLQCENGQLSGDEFIQKLSEKVGRQVSYEEAAYGWLGYAKEVPMKRLHLLEKLRQIGYTVMLLSNTNPFMMEWTRSNHFCQEGRPITDFFDRLYCSYELKMYKPDPAFFRYVLNDAGIKAEESLFIDDGQVNLDGAESVGLHTLLAKPDEDWTVELQKILNVSLI